MPPLRPDAPAYVTALIERWERVRPDENPRDMIPKLLNSNDGMIVFAQMAFEAGRTWQVEHPGARIDVPDYDAIAIPAPAIIYDKGGDKRPRARYIVGCTLTNGSHQWLVSGGAYGTNAGVVIFPQLATAGNMYEAHAHSKVKGKRKSINDAIDLLLNATERAMFRGEG